MSAFPGAALPGELIIPLVVCAIVTAGLIKRVDVFAAFVEGAKNGLGAAAGILPALVFMLTVTGMFRASGALGFFTELTAPAAAALGFPKEAVPLALMRPFSGSGALALFKELLDAVGPDSFAGRVGAVLMGSTETTFYTVAVYFGAAGVKKSGAALPAALAADAAGLIMSALTVRLFFG